MKNQSEIPNGIECAGSLVDPLDYFATSIAAMLLQVGDSSELYLIDNSKIDDDRLNNAQDFVVERGLSAEFRRLSIDGIDVIDPNERDKFFIRKSDYEKFFHQPN